MSQSARVATLAQEPERHSFAEFVANGYRFNFGGRSFAGFVLPSGPPPLVTLNFKAGFAPLATTGSTLF